jgi:hypothetical protein
MRIALGAPGRDLTEAEQARMLPMREVLKELLMPVELALLGRARGSRNGGTQDGCMRQQRRLWAVYDPSAPEPVWS